MKTISKVIFSNSNRMDDLVSGSVDLIVTSPPYPMVKMWDEMFCSQNRSIRDAFNQSSGYSAFELMHLELDRIWEEAYRVLRNGGFACINIGDATRSINNDFCLYSNHARILQFLIKRGFNVLPEILWRKQTNAPNKFMGSGMLPAGAYVTLEHEYILIARKGPKRVFNGDAEKRTRRESAIFWEERNAWFSDVWFDIKGTAQNVAHQETQFRSGAFPFEVAYRLINMYSVKGDTVLDPFLGVGTTMAASMASGRNCIGFEVNDLMKDAVAEVKENIVDFSNPYLKKRIDRHKSFSSQWIKENGPMKHYNWHYDVPVMSSQETELWLNRLSAVEETDDGSYEVVYSDDPLAVLG
jgi:DNA modification methylase